MLEAAHTPAPLDPDARARLNLLLRSAILGKTWAAWGSVWLNKARPATVDVFLHAA
ncbi:MAG: hypothetical protein H0V89_12945 [Deltaproteobacteria bacterium]|nr:hypothetical protein [Deltaproteobacteria bacterium]